MEWWSWILTAIGFVVFWWSGRSRNGWLLGILWELLWIAYALMSKQWGFVVAGVGYAAIFGNNYYRASKPNR